MAALVGQVQGEQSGIEEITTHDDIENESSPSECSSIASCGRKLLALFQSSESEMGDADTDTLFGISIWDHY